MIKKLIAGCVAVLLSVACFAEPETTVEENKPEEVTVSQQAVVTVPCGVAWSCNSIAPAGYNMLSTKYCPDTDGLGGSIYCYFVKGQVPGYVLGIARAADNCDVCRNSSGTAYSCSMPNIYTTWTCSAN